VGNGSEGRKKVEQVSPGPDITTEKREKKVVIEVGVRKKNKARKWKDRCLR